MLIVRSNPLSRHSYLKSYAMASKTARPEETMATLVLHQVSSHPGVLDPEARVTVLKAQIEQLKREKQELMSRSLTELREHEKTTKALDEQVQQLQEEVKQLNAEADLLMNAESRDFETTEEKQNLLYKQLMESQTEVLMLRGRVEQLEKQLKLREGATDFRRREVARNFVADNEQFLNRNDTAQVVSAETSTATSPVEADFYLIPDMGETSASAENRLDAAKVTIGGPDDRDSAEVTAARAKDLEGDSASAGGT
ncbi:hypothetical protein GGU10DRAFT_337846, partial [Lentinula aff. detonsa]